MPAIVVGCLVAVVVGSVLGWSFRTIYGPPKELRGEQKFATVKAVQGEVQKVIRLSVSATWSDGAAIPNQRSGTVTKVHINGVQRVESGDLLYDVDQIPVVAAEGAVPAFRDLVRGSKGADVEQLQTFLTSVGLRTGPANGELDGVTTRQVSAWHRSLGQEPTGEVLRGELLFIPKLPAKVALGGLITVASAVATSSPQVEGGIEAVSGLIMMPSRPTFSITLPPEQARIVAVGMEVVMHFADRDWKATVEKISTPSSDNNAVATLIGGKGETICGTQCGKVPVEGVTGIDGEIVIVPRAAGLVVPTAALVVDPTGLAAVTLDTGPQVKVVVKASAGGRAVVTGIKPGDAVRVPLS